MLTKNEIKYLKSLHQKKDREAAQCFLCEGDKVVTEALQSDFVVDEVFCLSANESQWTGVKNLRIISPADMNRISGLATAPGIAAKIQMKARILPQISTLRDQLFLLLDQVSDPGNLGTIIRIADWFGIEHVFCSENTTDVYNQKCIQSSMGSVFRVKVHYVNLDSLTDELLQNKISLFAAVMDGSAIKPGFAAKGGLILGSESHGIHSELLKSEIKKITIPSFGKAESLNVAVAAGILASYCRIH